MADYVLIHGSMHQRLAMRRPRKASRVVALLVLLVPLLVGSVATVAQVGADTPADGWTTLGGNPARTSATDLAGPAVNPAVRWHVTIPGEEWSSLSRPVLVADGVVVVSSGAGPVYALDQQSGAVKWSRDVGFAVAAYDESPATFAASIADGTLYVAGTEGEAQCDCTPPQCSLPSISRPVRSDGRPRIPNRRT